MRTDLTYEGIATDNALSIEFPKRPIWSSTCDDFFTHCAPSIHQLLLNTLFSYAAGSPDAVTLYVAGIYRAH